MRCGLEFFIIVKSLLSILVEGLQIGNVRRFFEEVGIAAIQLSNQHTKLGAPVANMVHTIDLKAQKLENAAN